MAIVVRLGLLALRAIGVSAPRRLAFALWLAAIAGLAALVAWDVARTLPL